MPAEQVEQVDLIDARLLLKSWRAFKKGDFSVRLPTDQIGMAGELAEAFNDTVELAAEFVAELSRIRNIVGKEGRTSERAKLRNAYGSWADCADSVNNLINDLVRPASEMATVAEAIARGDLTQKVPLEVEGVALKGRYLSIAKTINHLVEQLNRVVDEISRLTREVGTEGRLGGQAKNEGLTGSWKELTDNVNLMANNLTDQVRDMASATNAMVQGNFNRQITTPAKGEMLALKNSINRMVELLNHVADEIYRVTYEMGVTGQLGSQARVRGLQGTWQELVYSVNQMAGTLTDQIRDMAGVTTALAQGDLTRQISVSAQGEMLTLKKTINGMVELLANLTSELSRVTREMGVDGRLGGLPANVEGASGTWKELINDVNFMGSNLTNQMRNIAEVTTAVAQGDLTRKITIEARGEILVLKSMINTMVGQLSRMASELIRVAHEVGIQGKLGGQVEVRGLSGTWRDLTDKVNLMASNVSDQVREIATVTTAVAEGDLTRQITTEAQGEILVLQNTINTMVEQLNRFTTEVTRVAHEVGIQGKLGGQAEVRGVSGMWLEVTESVNLMARNLTSQVRDITEVTIAIAEGDLSGKITIDAQGELLLLKNTINTMVEQLHRFAAEMNRVAREVGIDGKLSMLPANVEGISGTWREMIDNMNLMAGNLTDQVDSIANVVTAVAEGNLKKKLTLMTSGDISDLADTINEMIDTLAIFAVQVTKVAREVGIEGKLGGQAHVPGAQGIWRDLTEGFNQLAYKFSTQVRAIGEVATAVTQGDLTRTITVEAQGEVAALKDNINQMIHSLRETTRVNTEQDWLKTNLTRSTRMLQGEREVNMMARMLLSELAQVVSAQHGLFYLMDTDEGEPVLKLVASYAYRTRKYLSNRFHLGEGLVGQCALEGQRILLNYVPNDYIQINSGLGEAPPLNIVVLPVLFKQEVRGVIELASFHPFSEIHLSFLEQLAESLGIVLNNISATMRTEELLKESRAIAEELQAQQEQLAQANRELEEKTRQMERQQEQLRRANAELEEQTKQLQKQQEQLAQANAELEEKTQRLEEQNEEVKRKNREIEDARYSLEEKAEQLARTSKYKSEFLTNMSHELRTPLNSMLILAQLLAQNSNHHLTEKQVEYAKTIHSAGADLLTLINEILDHAKIEAGTATVEIMPVRLDELSEKLERNYRQIANNKNVRFSILIDDSLPKFIHTDSKRVQQVLRNLLSNAFKFTEAGEVTLSIEQARSGWSLDHEGLNKADIVIAFSVSDTGIGIPADKQELVFEAFQQVDGSISRKYGGTGLGLAISREIAHLLQGELYLTASRPEKGSIFTFYLPQKVQAQVIKRTESGSAGRTLSNLSKYSQPTLSVSSRKSTSRSTQNNRADNQNTARTIPPPMTDRVGDERTADALPSISFKESMNGGAFSSSTSASSSSASQVIESQIVDDRHDLVPGDPILLIIEDDANFARILQDMAHERGFKTLVSTRGDTALAMARQYQPDGITLDIQLPMMNGWTVLDLLKHDPNTRHIPVHIISVTGERQRGLEQGAIGVLAKPATPAELKQVFDDFMAFRQRSKSLLLIEADGAQCNQIVDLIGGEDIKTTVVSTFAEALPVLKQQVFDCIVLNFHLPEIDGFSLLNEIIALQDTPIIVYTNEALNEQEKAQLAEISERSIIKVGSQWLKFPERLLDETALFLHRVEADLPAPKRQMLLKAHHKDFKMAGQKILIVDDDIRNIFALASLLEQQEMEVLYAENGKEGVELLQEISDIDLVLMDVMMPEMNGYQVMHQIRQDPKFASLPIIALTAKAMKGDREKCIEAGASDYISKPIDNEQLLSLLRVWLYGQRI